MEKLVKISERLKKCGYNTEIFETGSLAAQSIYEVVKGKTVGLGNSMTLAKIGIPETLHEYAKEVFPHLPGQAGENERNALTADYYLCSANALSMEGHIVNIDGTGNRTGATCFGPGHIIYVVGKNKITDTLEDALARAKQTAVKLAKHFNRKTPCAKTGKCENCLSPECVCSITTIHRKKPYGIDISIYLVNEDIGL